MTEQSSNRRVLFIGRWQPFHHGHAHIINATLREGKSVLIGVRDTMLDEQNPFTAAQRVDMIRHLYKDHGDQVQVMIIPDISEVRYSRGVGYEVTEVGVPDTISGISATEIRALRKEGSTDWEAAVPVRVANWLKVQDPFTIWITGLPSAGKTTLAKTVCRFLENSILVDGDVLRTGLCSGLGFSEEDRAENLRRAAHVCQYLNTSGRNVCAAFVSPTDALRKIPAGIIRNCIFVEARCPVDVCESRDDKGLWKKARAGGIKDFTGVSAPYEPAAWALEIPTDGAMTPETEAQFLLKELGLRPGAFPRSRFDTIK